MHGSFGKLSYERNRKKIQKTVDESSPSKFRNTILAGTMLHHFFAYLFKASPFCQHRNVAMHFSIHFNAFYQLIAVGLQTTIKIMQLNFRYTSCYSIKKFGRNIFGESVVMSFLFPATYKIETSFK